MAAYVRVGDWSVINRGATVGHDSELGAGVRLHPGATVAGVSTLGDRVVVGAGATVIDGIRVGDNVVLGAGAVATGNLLEAGPDSDAISRNHNGHDDVGVPARRVWGRLSSGGPTAGGGPRPPPSPGGSS